MNKEHEIEFRSKKINFFDGLEYNIQFQISTFNKKFRIKIELYVEFFYFSKVLFVRLLGFDLWNYFWRSKSIHENLIPFKIHSSTLFWSFMIRMINAKLGFSQGVEPPKWKLKVRRKIFQINNIFTKGKHFICSSIKRGFSRYEMLIPNILQIIYCFSMP